MKNITKFSIWTFTSKKYIPVGDRPRNKTQLVEINAILKKTSFRHLETFSLKTPNSCCLCKLIQHLNFFQRWNFSMLDEILTRFPRLHRFYKFCKNSKNNKKLPCCMTFVREQIFIHILLDIDTKNLC